MRTSYSMPRLALCLAAASSLAIATLKPSRTMGQGPISTSTITITSNDGDGFAFRDLVYTFAKITGYKFIIDAKLADDPKLQIKFSGSLKIQKTQSLAFFKALLWANNWACIPSAGKPRSFDLVRRFAKPAAKHQRAVTWVAPDLLAKYKDKADSFVLTSIGVNHIAGGMRLITLSGYGPDLHEAVKLIKQGIAARDVKKGAGNKK